MATISETSGAKPELAAGLAAGVNTLSLNQTVTFTLYVKMVLPLDGYVFWVNATLLTDTALYNAAQYNRLEYDNYDTPLPARTISVQGSLHQSIETQMLEDRNVSVNRMTFTSLYKVDDMNAVGPQMMYVAKEFGQQFAFTNQNDFYRQADLYHYLGHAIYPAMSTQLIDSMTGFDTESVIVSNSLPVWLTLNKYFPVYPSYLVPPNLKPPYAAVHIEPSRTEAIQAAPRLLPNSSTYQLTKDNVKITIYGERNSTAIEFQNYVLDYSLNYDKIGIMNMPIIRDEKMTQTEFGVIAMKKTIEFEVSYYQQNVRDVAVQYILSAFLNVTIGS